MFSDSCSRRAHTGRSPQTATGCSESGAPTRKEDVQHSPADDPECKSLRNVLDDEIVPLLLGARAPRAVAPAQAANAVFAPDAQQVARFADLCCQPSESAARRFIDQLMRQHVPLEDIFLKLITPAARHLGAHWEQDTKDFALVTLGLMHLHTVAHEIAYGDEDSLHDEADARRILLACAPGSQHFLGLTMVSQFFRRDGWRVVVEVTATEAMLERAIADEWFDAVGISVGHTEQVPRMRPLVARLRSASRNPHVCVVLGGPALLKANTTAQALGADGLSVDAGHGVQMTAALVQAQRALHASHAR